MRIGVGQANGMSLNVNNPHMGDPLFLLFHFGYRVFTQPRPIRGAHQL